MNDTSSTYRSSWLVRFTDGTQPDDLGDGLHWFPVGTTSDGRVMWRRPAFAVTRPEREPAPAAGGGRSGGRTSKGTPRPVDPDA